MNREAKNCKFVIKFLAVIFVVSLLSRTVLSVFYIPSGSMEPTLHKKSIHLGWRLSCILGTYCPKRGDVVVFREESGRHVVKRVVGLGDDVVSIENGCVHLNGEILDEPYLASGTETEGKTEYRVPDGCVFLLGDNRSNSLDSRYWKNPFIEVRTVYAVILI